MALRDSALLTAASARKLGLFEPFEGRRGIDVGFTIYAEWAGTDIIRFFAPTDPQISGGFPTSDTRFWRSTQVNFTRSKLKFGDREYFLCPISGNKCIKLIFYKGVVVSKPAFFSVIKGIDYAPIKATDIELRSRLLKLGTSKRWTKQKGQQILEWAGGLKGLDEAIDGKLRQEQRRIAKEQESWLWESRLESTSKGLDCGRSLGDTDPFNQLINRSHEWFEDPAPSVLPRRNPVSDTIDRFAELDIRVLIERGVLNRDYMTGQSLVWPEVRTGRRFISMYILPRDDELPQLIMEIEAPDGSIAFQDIKLIANRESERSRYFLCPVEQTREEILYFRDGFFASRSAQFLRYPVGGKRAVIDRMQKQLPTLSPAD